MHAVSLKQRNELCVVENQTAWFSYQKAESTEKLSYSLLSENIYTDQNMT